MSENLRAEYEICQRRGHQPSDIRLTMPVPKDICKWCGVEYWYTRQRHESNVPPPTEGDDE